MNVNGEKFQSLYALVCKSLAWRNHRTTLPQSALRAASSLREGAGMGLCHSSCRSETGRLRAIFIAPTKTQKPFPFTIHRGTLPQSRPLGVPAPSGREPGWGCTIQRAARKPQRCGRLSSPLRWLRRHYVVPWEIPRPEGVGGLGCQPWVRSTVDRSHSSWILGTSEMRRLV